MLTTTETQQKLKSIGYYKEFTVVFMKKDGTERKITGFMEEPEGELKKQSTAVPVKVTQGDAAGQWRSFRLDSVLSIDTAAIFTETKGMNQ